MARKRTTFRLDSELAERIDKLVPHLADEAWKSGGVRLGSRNAVVEWMLYRAVTNAERRQRQQERNADLREKLAEAG